MGGTAGVVRVFLENGAKVNEMDGMNMCMLNLALFGGKIDMAEIMLEFGADGSIVDRTQMNAVDVLHSRFSQLASSDELDRDPALKERMLKLRQRLLDAGVKPAMPILTPAFL